MSSNWVFSIFFPLIGTFLSNGMWIVPLKNTMDARTVDQTIKLSPTPFVATILNCLGWTIYAFLRLDPFLFAANSFGVIVGLYNSISYLLLHSEKKSLPKITGVEVGVFSVICFWAILLLILYFSRLSSGTIASVVGTWACSINAIFYCSPMAELIIARDFALLDAVYLPMIIINMITALTWGLYGLFGIHDIFVWSPNVVGVSASGIMILLKLGRYNWQKKSDPLISSSHVLSS